MSRLAIALLALAILFGAYAETSVCRTSECLQASEQPARDLCFFEDDAPEVLHYTAIGVGWYWMIKSTIWPTDFTVVVRTSEPAEVIALLPANIEPDLPACEEVRASRTSSFHPRREL